MVPIERASTVNNITPTVGTFLLNYMINHGLTKIL